MSLEFYYAIALIVLIPVILFNITAWYIADQGQENNVAIDIKGILTLSNREISPKYYDEGYHIENFQLCLWSISTR